MPTTRVSDLITIASRITRLTPAQITGHDRQRPLTRVRKAVAYVAVEQGKHTRVLIGQRLGGRDHSTIIHAHKSAFELMRTDADFRLLVERLFVEAERHQPYEVPAEVLGGAVVQMSPVKQKPAAIPRDDEHQGEVANRNMRRGSRKLLEALLAA